jgi:hypothetical protein
VKLQVRALNSPEKPATGQLAYTLDPDQDTPERARLLAVLLDQLRASPQQPQYLSNPTRRLKPSTHGHHWSGVAIHGAHLHRWVRLTACPGPVHLRTPVVTSDLIDVVLAAPSGRTGSNSTDVLISPAGNLNAVVTG